MISFSDLFTITMNPVQVILTLIVGLLVGLYVWCIYKKTFSGVMYSRTYGMALVMMTIVTALMLMLINNSLTLSLGMVGALSIVRFRTAVKEPTDTAFLFWAIATGIICGAGYVTISILMTLLLGLLFVAVHAFAGKQKHGTYMIVVRYDSDSEVESKLMSVNGYKMKNKTMTGNYTELVAEIKLTDTALKKIDYLRNIPGVREVTVMNSVAGSVL